MKNVLLTEKEKYYYNNKIKNEEIVKISKKINTGDICLTVGENNKQERLVKNFTNSPITHIFLFIWYEEKLYCTESNSLTPKTRKVDDYIHGKNKNGVRLCLFKDIYRYYDTSMFIRKISPFLSEDHENAIIEFYRLYNNKQFEQSLLQMYNSEKKFVIFNKKAIDEFFCSEYIAELFQFIGLLRGPKNGGLASKFFTPKDFIKWQPDDKRFTYGKPIQIKPKFL